ncbi:MAG: HEAT repeat domain-containing protein [Planctomycetaceae bacterium]|nr:HEAT repeat domain-containing protein [Planctomycetaceae bacterium]
MNPFRFRLLVLSTLAVGISTLGRAAGPADGNPRTVYFTVGDAQDLLEFPPMDSRTSIATLMETLDEQWHMERIWWRGGQDEIWGEEFVIRPENRLFAKIWGWWRDLQYRKVGTNRIAVEEAHQRGMQIYLTYGLFDSGSQADAGYSGFPYAVEDRLRVEHPEWAPVNRWGTWRQGGPIEFAYPEARQQMADYLTKYVVDGNYDGISFLTYAENFSMRYEDEFGYSAPIVAEFQEKYGVDIRTEEFDREAWRQMRGRHVTEFLRLLKKQLAAHGKQVAMCVHGQQPEKAILWNIDGGVPTAGNFRWSIEEWLKGDVVDEICIYTPAADEVIERLMQQVRDANSPVRLSVFRSRGDLPANLQRIMFLGREIESGYDSDHWIDYPDEQLELEPVASLNGDDVYARRRVLTLALKGKQALTTAQLAVALKDRDLYVRRTALRTIAKHKIPGLTSELVAALDDPEITVKCLAAVALGDVGDPAGIEPLLTAAFRNEGMFQFQDRAVAEALKKYVAVEANSTAVKAALVRQLSSQQAHTRELTLYYFTLIGAPATPELEQLLTTIVLHDDSEAAREQAVVNLRSSFGATQTVTHTIRTVMREDQSHAVQVRAAASFAAMMARFPDDDPARAAALDELVAFFRQYGDGGERTDDEWGWRLLGNSLLEFGPSGEAALKELMADAANRDLSDRAWRILYLKQGDRFFPITEAEDVAAHKLHPWLH